MLTDDNVAASTVHLNTFLIPSALSLSDEDITRLTNRQLRNSGSLSPTDAAAASIKHGSSIKKRRMKRFRWKTLRRLFTIAVSLSSKTVASRSARKSSWCETTL